MGSNQDIMREFARKELIRTYPSSDGWDVVASGQKGADQVFVAKRRNKGKTEMADILVTFNRKVTQEMIDRLAGLRKNPAAASILIVPLGTDVSLVPAGIRVRFMRSFAFDEKELVWIRKRFQSTVTGVAAAA